MTPSQLKQNHLEHHPDSYFFTRKTMKFFGDTMANFGVRSEKVKRGNTVIDVWCLYRKRPIRLLGPSFFSKDDFALLHNVRPD